jgi:hypothetical protein
LTAVLRDAGDILESLGAGDMVEKAMIYEHEQLSDDSFLDLIITNDVLLPFQ